MINILVTGAGGQLGQEFKALENEYSGITFHFFTHHDLDILNEKELRSAADKINPDYLINCAAYTAVDKAEEESTMSYRINSLACRSLVHVFEESKTKIVHYSSDYVYHTCFGKPLTENCPTEPQSVYAKTKLEGEQFLRASSIPTLILRTSWVYSHFGSNFVKTMLRLSGSKEILPVVYDQIGAPTYAYDLARVTLDIIEKTHQNQEKKVLFNDVYNYSNEGVTSWYDFATFIFKIKEKSTKVVPITTAEYPTLAKRPNWSLLDKHKIKTQFDIEIPHWCDALERCLKHL
ncbi:MAG: dTDP-4-dehydrorhamnose reductase [Saprospiraceae bacterium]